MTKYPSQLQDKFNLRLPDGMRNAIAERAKTNGRSMNSEIIQILEDAINPESEKIEVLNAADRIAASADAKDMIVNQQETIELQTKIIENLKQKINILASILTDKDDKKPKC